MFDDPVMVEIELTKLLNHSSLKSNPKERFIEYCGLLESKDSVKKLSFWRPFLLGYFGQQAGTHCTEEKAKKEFFIKALVNYQKFQGAKGNANTDIRYFAQWQIGWLQQSLEYEWSVAEESYLKAIEYDPERAEALREIIIYQYVHQNWAIADIYSSYCKEHFLGKIPSGGKWFINTAFYKWKILKYAISIFLNLNKNKQAKESAKELFEQYATRPDLSEEDKKEIYTLKESWGKLV